MKIVDIANEIFIDAGSPANTSIPAIAFWIRGKVGTLNILLYEDLSIDETTQELVDTGGTPLDYQIIAIIKQMYRIYDYEVQIRTQMNAMAADTILKFEDQGTMITKVNRNMVSQTLRQVRKDEMDSLNRMITHYILGSHQAVPTQVAGDDTMPGGLTSPLPSYSIYLRR